MEVKSPTRPVTELDIALSGANREIAQQQTNAPGQPATLPRINLGGAKLDSRVLSHQLGPELQQRVKEKGNRERKVDPLPLLAAIPLRGGVLEKREAAARKTKTKAEHLPLRKTGHPLLLPRKRRHEEPRLLGTRTSLLASDGLRAAAPQRNVIGGIRPLAETSRKESVRKVRIANSFIILTK
jgi:hypothetical protein